MYDFNIVTLPRHGSHMLASFMDDHHDIQCTGEYFFKKMIWRDGKGSEKGGMRGYTYMCDFIDELPARKHIVLLRDPIDVIRSCDKMDAVNTTHYKEKQIIALADGLPPLDIGRISQVRDHQAKMLKYMEGKDHIIVRYEEITGNKHISKLPRDIAEKIFNYLGVNTEAVETDFVKTNVV